MRLVASVLLFTLTTTAAPSRTQTQCRCKIVQEAAQPIYTPSAAHWSPANPTPSPVAADVCASLAIQLERFQHTEPELYHAYMRDAKKPVPTNVLMAGGSSTETKDAVASSSPQPPPKQGRIACYAAPKSSGSDFQSSFLSLWALQILILVSILACVAEGIHLGIQRYRLLAIPTGPHINDVVASPGAEKKLRAYESTKYFVTRYASGRKEFIAYEDDSDDESNRPVM
ncbi:hypothetical protein GMOD_00007312 [Pyrenophora seminiperda CCB06]|uniref:Uncharacterized protein n=1 Tax=Pyrenophora seminiperda CCB06 TaxID=1302712 RepID=A0A3M7MCQ7_9PLEO|nr:hypothetical protein GMOD_00007312 [Pyrenophora seminiperda CCB06]